MNKNKSLYMPIAFGVVLLVALSNLDVVIGVIRSVFSLLLPVLVGLILAFVLNVPVTGFQNLLAKLFPKTRHQHWRPVGFVLTIICVGTALFLLGAFVVPQLVGAVSGIVVKVEANWPAWMTALTDSLGRDSVIMDWISELNLRELLTKLFSGAGTVLGEVAQAALSAVSGLTTTVFGLVIAGYVVLSKDLLGRQMKKLLLAFCGKKATDRFCHVAGLCSNTYKKFLSGQCLEALILGVLILITFAIFRFPYPLVVAAVSVVCAFIPYVGALISCLVAGLLALLISPKMALWAVVAYVVVQFIETQFIYPQVVGNSVGLSAMWTLLAALMGGSLFGLVGIIFFIPLVAVMYELLREATDARLERKSEIEAKKAEALEKIKNAAGERPPQQRTE